MSRIDDAPENARRCFESGYRAQMARRLDEALDWYGQSIEIYPTAEAHTFRGWVMSWQGRWEDAIAECHVAIRLDPEFGNPYNDIGAYLIELCRLDEAIEWLERAKRAPRYEPRHFPYFNLSRVYVMQGKLDAAIGELRAALAVEPGYVAARRELHRLLGMLN